MLSDEELRSALAAVLPEQYHTVEGELARLIATALNGSGELRVGNIVRIGAPSRLAPALNALTGCSVGYGQLSLLFGEDGQIMLGRAQAAVQARVDTIDARGSQGMVITPQGPVTQIYGTQQNVHTGGGSYIDKLQVAHLSLTLTEAGGLVRQVATALPSLEPKPRPVWRLPDYVPSLVGRATDESTLLATLATYRFVEVYGPVDIGKSALLEASVTQQTGQALPDGAIFLRPRQTTAADLLQEIHSEFFSCSIANLKLTDAQLTRDLQTIRALVVLDNDRLPKEELEVLLAALHGSHIILSTRERGGRHPGRIRTLALRGLPLPAARDLYSATLERPLAAAESAAVDALITALEGSPGAIIRAAVIARDEQQVSAASTLPVPAARGATPTLDAQAQRLLAQLTADERSLVGVLAAVYDARLGEKPLLRIAGVAESSPALATLIRQQVVRTASPRYNLVETFVPFVLAADNAAGWRESAIAYFVAWMRAPATTPEQILEEAEAILQLLRQAATAGRWEEVRLLARAVETALITGRQWGAWRQVLDWQAQAARALRDPAAEGWALHQLGTRALCMGDAVEAQGLLRQALNIRMGLGDRAGADVTRHNLNLIQPPPPASSSAPPRAPSSPQSPGQIPSQYRMARDSRESRRRGCLWPLLLGVLIVLGVLWVIQTQWRGQRVVAPPIIPSSTASVPTLKQPTALPTTEGAPTKESPTVGATGGSTGNGKDEPPSPPTTEPTKVPDPQIVSFSADSQKLAPGEGTDLHWEVLDATSIVLEPNQIEVSSYNQYYVEPKEMTTYVLRATNASGVIRESDKVMIEVIQPTVETPKLQPAILGFSAKPIEVQAGNPVQLCYMTENAYDIQIQPQIGFLLNRVKSLENGCVDVTPTDEKSVYTLTYTLTVYDQNKQFVAAKDAEVRVLPSK